MNSALIAIVFVNALWLIARRLRKVELGSEAAMGWFGLALVPMRLVVKFVTWVAPLWIVALFTITGLDHAVAALLAGFVLAYPINLAISRYEEKLRRGGVNHSGLTA